MIRIIQRLTCAIALFSAAVSAISITGRFEPSPALPNLSQLPPTTVLTLSTTPLENSRSSLILADNTFRFRNVTAGSYLLDVNCRTHIFPPLRVDVAKDGSV